MFKFPAQFHAEADGGYSVTFRDIPEAITQGESWDDAQAAAQDALVTAMDFYFEDARPVPLPSEPRVDEVVDDLPVSVAAKVLLLNRMLESRTRPVDLAAAMAVKPQEVTRILNLHHTTKIDTLAAAFKALGGEMEISFKPVVRV